MWRSREGQFHGCDERGLGERAWEDLCGGYDVLAPALGPRLL